MDAEKLFEARVLACIAQAERGAVGQTAFLSPAEQMTATGLLAMRGIPTERYLLYGGYADAERRRLFVLPDWYESGDLCMVSDEIIPVRICGSGFHDLTHRQYMGSILALGIERDVIGDIVVTDPHHAVVFCVRHIVSFLLSGELTRVASDTVKVEQFTLPPSFENPRQTVTVTDTVMSPRLDGIVAALTNLSREKAKTAVTSGDVYLNFSRVQEPDRIVAEGDLLSVTGYGKFRIDSVSDTTKKGRLRLIAQKFI